MILIYFMNIYIVNRIYKTEVKSKQKRSESTYVRQILLQLSNLVQIEIILCHEIHIILKPPFSVDVFNVFFRPFYLKFLNIMSKFLKNMDHLLLFLHVLFT